MNNDKFFSVIDVLGGKPTPATPGTQLTVEAFNLYSKDGGVVHFTGKEILYQRNSAACKAIGEVDRYPVPPLIFWPRALALAIFSDRIRREVNSPVLFKSWWRWEGLNTASGGAPNSDHIDACAGDLEFESLNKQQIAGAFLEPFYRSGIFNMSLGLSSNGKIIHLGMFSAQGHRRWYY